MDRQGVVGGASRDRDWCILRTAAPQTLKLAASLAQAGIGAWTPIERIKRRVPRSKGTEYHAAPLAPTYVFVQACHLTDLLEIERAEITPHLRFSVFRHYGATVRVRHVELHPLRALQQASYVASLPRFGRSPGKPRGAAYEIGDAVTFTQGGLAGITCYVEASDGLTTTLTMMLFGRTSGLKAQTLHLRSLNVPAETSAA